MSLELFFKYDLIVVLTMFKPFLKKLISIDILTEYDVVKDR